MNRFRLLAASAIALAAAAPSDDTGAAPFRPLPAEGEGDKTVIQPMGSGAEFDFSGASVSAQIANLNFRLAALENAQGGDVVARLEAVEQAHGESLAGVKRLLRRVFGEE